MSENIKPLQIIGQEWDVNEAKDEHGKKVYESYNELMPVVFRRSAITFISCRLRTHVEVMEAELKRTDVEWSDEDIQFYKEEMEMTQTMIDTLELFE